MIYFLTNTSSFKNLEIINYKKKKKFVNNNYMIGKSLNKGDILTINFWIKAYSYSFEGLCLGIKKKNLNNNNAILILRNIFYNIGIELIISYYNYRLFCNILMSDYKRKKYNYKSSKLYFLCYKKNQATKI